MKVAFGIIAVLISTVSLVIYLRDIVKGNTKPHLYTWVVWAITQAIATIGVWYGGGSSGAITMLVITAFVFSVLCFAIPYGTKNIIWEDTLTLIVALIFIVLWLRHREGLLGVRMAAFIDVLGYIPTARKSYNEPWSESLTAWGVGVLANLCTLTAMDNYNQYTITYGTVIALTSTLLIILCLIRRHYVVKPCE